MKSTNKEVKFEDVDKATTRRIVVVPFYRTFEPKGSSTIDGVLNVERDETLLFQKEGKLQGKLIKELPGIFFKLITRLKELSLNNFNFSIPESLQLSKIQVESSSTSALEFLHASYVIDPNYPDLVSTEEIYNRYVEWYKETRDTNRVKMASRQFWQVISKNYPALTTSEKIFSPVLKKKTAAKRFLREKEDAPYKKISESSSPNIPF